MKPIQKNDKVGSRRSEGVGEGEREKQKMESDPGCSKVNKEARLVERKICFISEASNLVTWGVCVCVCVYVQRADSCPKADSLPLTISGHELLYRPVEEAICRKNTFSSDGHLKTSHVVG